MTFTPIDREHWARREYFDHYFSQVPCTYSAVFKLDITKLRQQGRKLYPTMLYQISGEAKREDCSKIQRRGKPTNSALLESHYQSEHLQDIGMSRPICCYTSK